MVSKTIYLTPEQKQLLDELHERTRVPTSVRIREGIDLLLKERTPVAQLSLFLPDEGDAQ